MKASEQAADQWNRLQPILDMWHIGALTLIAEFEHNVKRSILMGLLNVTKFEK